MINANKMITFKYHKKPELTSEQKLNKHLDMIIEGAINDRPHIQRYTIEELNRMPEAPWAATRLNREILEIYDRHRRHLYLDLI